MVDEARRIDNRSGKSMEEKRREAEEKVVWISLTSDLDLFNSQKYFYRKIFSGGEACEVCEGEKLRWSNINKSKK